IMILVRPTRGSAKPSPLATIGRRSAAATGTNSSVSGRSVFLFLSRFLFLIQSGQVHVIPRTARAHARLDARAREWDLRTCGARLGIPSQDGDASPSHSDS